MSGPAEVRIAGQTGIFEADEAELVGDWLHAEGRWRHRVAVGGFSYQPRRAYSWPARTVREIRWSSPSPVEAVEA